MKKISFLSLFFVAMAATVVWSQDEAPKQSRNLSTYMDVSSGQLAPGNVTLSNKTVTFDNGNGPRSKVFEGSEVEWGIRYSQNFKSAPKVSMGGTMAFVMNYGNVYRESDNSFLGTTTGVGASLGNIKANVWVAVPHFMLLIDARGLMGLYLNHGVSFGKGGSFSYGWDAEFFYTGNPWFATNPVVTRKNDPDDEKSRPNPNYVLDYTGFWLSYSVSLGKGFAYSMGLQFRMEANPYNRFNSVEFDPGASFGIRWNNTFSYAVDGWNFYLQFRLHGYNLAKPTKATLNDYDPTAVFQIITGLGYSFDLSK